MMNILQTKRIEQVCACLPACLPAWLAVAVSGTWVANAGAQTLITKSILIPDEPYFVSVGDIDGDGLLDFVVSHFAGNDVKVYQAVDEDNFVLAESWGVPQAAGIVIADFDGDEILDIAFGSYLDNNVTIAYGAGDFGFTIDSGNAFTVDVRPSILSTMNHCEWLSPDLIVAESPDGAVVYVSGPAYNPVATLVTETFDIGECSGRTLTWQPCNDYTMPDCDPNPTNVGIQECMRAAWCRRNQCMWAACIEYEDGGFLRGPIYIGQQLACASIYLIEHTACIPSAFIPN